MAMLKTVTKKPPKTAGEEESGVEGGTCPGVLEVVGPPAVGAVVVDGAGAQASGVVLEVGEGVDGGGGGATVVEGDGAAPGVAAVETVMVSF